MDNYPLLNLFLTMLYLFLWVAWIFLLVRILTDVFRSRDLGGWGKAGWTLLLLVLPWLGALVYLIVRGGGMHTRDQQVMEANREAMRDWLSQPGASGGSSARSSADELAKLADLHRTGVLSDEEFAAQKAKLLTA